jgi:hypothetical protein
MIAISLAGAVFWQSIQLALWMIFLDVECECCAESKVVCSCGVAAALRCMTFDISDRGLFDARSYSNTYIALAYFHIH